MLHMKFVSIYIYIYIRLQAIHIFNPFIYTTSFRSCNQKTNNNQFDNIQFCLVYGIQYKHLKSRIGDKRNLTIWYN